MLPIGDARPSFWIRRNEMQVLHQALRLVATDAELLGQSPRSERGMLEMKPVDVCHEFEFLRRCGDRLVVIRGSRQVEQLTLTNAGKLRMIAIDGTAFLFRRMFDAFSRVLEIFFSPNRVRF